MSLQCAPLAPWSLLCPCLHHTVLQLSVGSTRVLLAPRKPSLFSPSLFLFTQKQVQCLTHNRFSISSWLSEGMKEYRNNLSMVNFMLSGNDQQSTRKLKVHIYIKNKNKTRMASSVTWLVL